MWAQAMVEYGLLDSAAAGVSAVQYHVEAALADGQTRWILGGAIAVLAYYLIRRR